MLSVLFAVGFHFQATHHFYQKKKTASWFGLGQMHVRVQKVTYLRPHFISFSRRTSQPVLEQVTTDAQLVYSSPGGILPPPAFARRYAGQYFAGLVGLIRICRFSIDDKSPPPLKDSSVSPPAQQNRVRDKAPFTIADLIPA